MLVPWITCVGGCTWLTPWTRDHSNGQTKAPTGSKMLYEKANWLLSSAVGQTDQWSAMPVEISRWHFNFCQTAQIIICARDLKMIREEISKFKMNSIKALRAKLRLVRTYVQFLKTLQIGRYPLFYSSVHSPRSSLKWTVQTTEKTKSGLPWNQKVNGLKSAFTIWYLWTVHFDNFGTVHFYTSITLDRSLLA